MQTVLSQDYSRFIYPWNSYFHPLCPRHVIFKFLDAAGVEIYFEYIIWLLFVATDRSSKGAPLLT